MAMLDNEEPRLCLSLNEEQLPNLFLIMQNGFWLKAKVGCSLHEFLTQELGLSNAFIEERIQTIFLDGKPVDDLATAIIKDGTSIALSSAMPGLVGAAMRRGGFYGTLRSTITYREEETQRVVLEGNIHLKLYNLLMVELGPLFLSKGICVESSYLNGFLSDQPVSFWNGCRDMSINGKPVSKEQLLGPGTLTRHERTMLFITAV